MNTSIDAVVVPAPGTHVATVIWLHGLGADGHDFEGLVPLLGLPPHHGTRFVFPHAPMRPVSINNGVVMRAWYDIVHTDLRQRQDAAGILDSAQRIDQLIDNEIKAGIASRQVILAGFSQGGALTLHCGLRRTNPLGGLLALSTYLPLHDTALSEHTQASLKTPILMCHGKGDPIIPLRAGRDSAEQLRALGYQVQWEEYMMGHAVCEEEIERIGSWLRECLKLP